VRISLETSAVEHTFIGIEYWIWTVIVIIIAVTGVIGFVIWRTKKRENITPLKKKTFARKLSFQRDFRYSLSFCMSKSIVITESSTASEASCSMPHGVMKALLPPLALLLTLPTLTT
jgi:hypothetical protein